MVESDIMKWLVMNNYVWNDWFNRVKYELDNINTCNKRIDFSK